MVRQRRVDKGRLWGGGGRCILGPVSTESKRSEPSIAERPAEAQESPAKIALACSGVGRVQRGFERLMLDILDLVRADLDITLFKGGGEERPGERVVWNAGRHGRLAQVLPVHRLFGRPSYWTECWTYAVALFPKLVAGRYDLVHYIDIPVGQALARLRSLFRARFKLLYTQGVVIDPRYYPRADYIHQVAQTLHDDAVRAGYAESTMRMVPCGVHSQRFSEGASRAELRKKHGIPEDTFVVLSVAALNRVQKRIDHVIEEVAGLSDQSFLWLDGQAEEADLRDLALARLGARVRITQVPSVQVAELYRLADVFVLGSLQESFGLSAVEAMCAGLPVLLHRSPHFEWLSGGTENLVPMNEPGALTAALRSLRDAGARGSALGRKPQAQATSRYDWSALKAPYLEVYRAALRA